MTGEGPDWNVVVTSQHGFQRRLRRALWPCVRLHGTEFRNVFLGTVDDPDACLGAVADLLERRPRVRQWLGKIVPLARTFAVDPGALDAQLQDAVAPFVDALVDRTFHVRIERRGHKGVIDTHASERALGEHVFEALRARGGTPVVRFRDPDAVLVVEIVGDVGGIGLITRELRTRFPFVKID